MNKCILSVGLAMMAFGVWADSTWNGTVDTNLANPANWSAGIPTSGNAQFNAPIGSLTLSADLTMNGVALCYNGNGAINLDLGAANTLTVGYRTFVKPGAVVTLQSGTYRHTGERFFVGDNCSDGTFIVDGANAKLYGMDPTTNPNNGNNFIEIGSSNFATSKNNLVKVQNGGYARGVIQIGRLSSDDTFAESGTNTLWVTGAGSTLETYANTTCVGVQQGQSQLLVDDRATATVSGKLAVGQVLANGNRVHAGSRNRVRVAGGATMSVADVTAVGAYSCSNLFEVAGGASVSLQTLYTSQEVHDTIKDKVHPFANVVRVTGTNSLLTLNNQVKIGCYAGSYGDSLEALDGAKIHMASSGVEYNIGEVLGSTGHRLLLDGGILDAQNAALYIGKYGDGNTLVVTNGGLAVIGPGANFAHVGHCSASNVLEVAAGGTVRCGTQLRLGWYNRADGTKPGGNKLWIHGPGATFLNTGDFRFDRFDGQIGNQLVVEDGGVFETTAPVQMPYVQSDGSFSSNLQVRVTGEGSRFVVTNGAEFVLGYNYSTKSTNVNAHVYVADGGLFRQYGGTFILGHGKGADADSVCARNGLHVGPGGKFVWTGVVSDSVKPTFKIGNNTRTWENYLRVEGEFEYVATGKAYVDLFSVGYNGSSNRFEVVNGGRAKVSGGGFFIGAGTTAVDCLVTVGTNSVLCVTNTEYAAIGNGGAGASLVVDGGTLDMLGTSRLVAGSTLAASNASFVVKNGGQATLTRIVLGDKAPNCSVIVDDATLTLVDHSGISAAGYLDVGYSAASASADPRNASVTVKGRNAKIRIARNIRLRNATAQIRFVVPAEGFAETPFVCSGGFETVTAGASVHVSADPAWPRGSRATLLTTVNTGSIASLALTCDPELRIRRTGNAIIASKPGGGAIFIR